METRSISHAEEFQIICANTPPSESGLITPQSLSAGCAYRPSIK